MSVEVQQRLAATGRVWFERCLVSTQPDLAQHVPFETITQQIAVVGVATTVIATDYGMPQYPEPAEGLGHFIEGLLDARFSAADIRRMVRDNPSHLLKCDEPVSEEG